MAGIKITDLSALSVAEATDYLCIVDVSDTSQSPAGTTKKIELGNVVESGTWTPTFSEPTGAASNPVSSNALYSKIGSIVTCTINGSVDLDFTSHIQGYFVTTLPVGSSGNSTRGVVNCEITENINGVVFNDKIVFNSDLTTDIGTVDFYAIFQYEID
jgi:hypothetical protein